MAQRGGGHGGWGGSHGGAGGGGFSGGSRDSGGSRSSSHYGTIHNVYHENSQSRVTVDRLPGRDHYDPHGWAWNHHDLFHDGYRWGYYHYDRWWRDDFFLFGFYLFEPVGLYVYSPWYYYPCLPPYMDESHVTVVNGEPTDWGWTDGFSEYKWEEPRSNSGDYTDLDYGLQDLCIAFENHGPDAIDRVCPKNGRVAIYLDGHYKYSLDSGAFFDTFKDGATGPRTTHYKILDVKTNGHDVANVLAEDYYTDPWGKSAVVYHTYRMVQEGSNVVIRSFGTDRTRPW